jgi:hypothetical protein
MANKEAANGQKRAAKMEEGSTAARKFSSRNRELKFGPLGSQRKER